MAAPLLPGVRRALEARGLRVEVDEVEGGAHVVAEPADGPGPWALVLAVDEDDRRVSIYSIAPVEVPPERRRDVAEVVARATWGLLDTCLELDLDDGEVRVRCALLAGDRDLDEAVLDHLVSANVVTMDTYLDAVLDVAAGTATPEAAVAAAEA